MDDRVRCRAAPPRDCRITALPLRPRVAAALAPSPSEEARTSAVLSWLSVAVGIFEEFDQSGPRLDPGFVRLPGRNEVTVARTTLMLRAVAEYPQCAVNDHAEL